MAEIEVGRLGILKDVPEDVVKLIERAANAVPEDGNEHARFLTAYVMSQIIQQAFFIGRASGLERGMQALDKIG